MKPSFLRLTSLVLFTAILSGCESAYYSTMEKLGVEKRDILVDKVEETRDAQTAAQEQFRDALEQYKAVVNFQGGKLEESYNRLKGEYDASEQMAKDIAAHISQVEDVSEDLFKEWEKELSLIKNPSLRAQSSRQLRDTRARAKQLIAAMWRAERSVHPVLDSLRDQVYYLKHNLNAQAVTALRGELRAINVDVDRLVSQMQQAINEANAFIKDMEQ